MDAEATEDTGGEEEEAEEEEEAAAGSDESIHDAVDERAAADVAAAPTTCTRAFNAQWHRWCLCCRGQAYNG